MKTNSSSTQVSKSRAAAHTVAQAKPSDSSFEDRRPEAIEAQQLSTAIVQAQAKPNTTGMPDNLKSGIENLSGHSLDDVKVHYNSSKPSQLNAHAYAQGTDIHVAGGQEKHLPHEAWHVVQQKQGRVQPTTEVNGAAVNDDVGLEREADVMGGKALQMKAIDAESSSTVNSKTQKQPLQLKRLKRDIKGIGSGYAGQWLGSFNDSSFHVTIYNDDASQITSRGAQFVSPDFVSEFHITQYSGDTVVGRRFYNIDTGATIGRDRGTITSKFATLATEFMAHISSAQIYSDEEAQDHMDEQAQAELSAARDKVQRRKSLIKDKLAELGIRAPVDSSSSDSYKLLGKVNITLKGESLPATSLDEINEYTIQEWPTPGEAQERGMYKKKR